MHHGRLFYCRLVLKAEADSNSSWTRLPAWLGGPCWPPKEVAKVKDVLGHLKVFSTYLEHAPTWARS